MNTPWGPSQDITVLIPDTLLRVDTASHGGFYAPFINDIITEFSQRGWFEEDCDWVIPFIVLEGELREQVERGRLKGWYAENLEDIIRDAHTKVEEPFNEYYGAIADNLRDAGYLIRV